MSGAIGSILRLGRPKFLAGGFLMYGIGAAIANRAIAWRVYLLGQGTVTALQWMTHYANDYFDFDADRANHTPTRWSGGSRVLVGGELTRATALAVAVLLALAALAVAVPLVAIAGARAAMLVAAIAAIAWSYSAPPLRLCARGLGELATALVVAGLVPWLAFSLQAPDLRGAAVLAGALVSPVLLQIAMSLAIELPDAGGDAATGKRTLVVRLGKSRGRALYRAVTAAAYAWLPIAVALGHPPRLALAAAITAPVAAWRIARADRDGYDVLVRWAVLLFGATAVAVLVAAVTM